MKAERSGSSQFDRLIRIERPVADDSFDGAGSGGWMLVDEVYASVQDVLPSRGERASEGINLATHPARVRTWPRGDITGAMRFVIPPKFAWEAERVVQIVSGPAFVEAGAKIEFMVEDYSTAGNPA